MGPCQPCEVLFITVKIIKLLAVCNAIELYVSGYTAGMEAFNLDVEYCYCTTIQGQNKKLKV